MKQLLTIISLFFFMQPVFADELRVGTPTYSGTGCPQGSVSIDLPPDGKTVEILFDSYIAEAGITTGRKVDRKTCQFALPIYVPAGMSVAFSRINYRGYNSLPLGASSEFNVEYFFAGSAGPNYKKIFQGALNSDYLLNNVLSAGSMIWSPCGSEVTLRVNTSMMVRTNSANLQTFATVDGADLGSGLTYFLQWRRCENLN